MCINKLYANDLLVVSFSSVVMRSVSPPWPASGVVTGDSVVVSGDSVVGTSDSVDDTGDSVDDTADSVGVTGDAVIAT